MNRRLILVFILAAYCLLGALFAANTPAWQAPDEPAHFNYVATLAETGSFPVLHFGDYGHGYLEQIKAAKFPPEMPITPIRYESHQPPLYYVLAAPLYSLTGGNLTALRLLSVLLGAGIVVLAYGIGRRAAPAQPAIALGAAAVVAFLPQHLATVSQVGNDVLAELLLAAVLFVLAGMVGRPVIETRTSPRALPLRLGILLGLILITKTTAAIAVPLALGVLVWQWFRERASWRRILLEGCAVLLPAALISLPWFARNVTVYGWPDFLGLIRHDQIVLGQTRTAQFVAENGWNAYWRRAAEWTFKSFAGVFGWMGVWLDSRVYYALGIWMSVPTVAWAVTALQRMEADKRLGLPPQGVREQALPEHLSRDADSRVAALLAISALLTVLTYVYYNTTFLQHQGRYLFPALIPIAIFLAVGWQRALAPRVGPVVAGVAVLWAALLAAWGLWVAPLPAPGIPKWPVAITVAAGAAVLGASLLPRRWLRWAFAAPFVLLPLAALYALFGAIIPQLTR